MELADKYWEMRTVFPVKHRVIVYGQHHDSCPLRYYFLYANDSSQVNYVMMILLMATI